MEKRVKWKGTNALVCALMGATAFTTGSTFFTATAVAAEEALEVILITARKREESLIEIPASVTALTPQMLGERNISNLDDVGKHVPNLNISRFGVGNTAQAAIFIRGIGLQDHIITTDPGVGVYLDGVYLGRQMGSNLSLINIERIEVLRGPQGTLYGRNSIGGAVNIITRTPDGDQEAIVNVKGGTRGRAAIDGYFEFPLAENLAVGVSSYFKRREGVGKFLLLDNPEAEVGEEEEFGGRITANWTPTERFSLQLSVDGMDANNGQSPYQIEITGLPASSNFVPGTPIQNRPDPFIGDFPALQPGFPTDLTAFGFPDLIADDPDDSLTTVAGLDTTTNTTWGASITANLDINDSLAAKLIASYRFSEYTGGLDDDESPLRLSEFPEDGEAEQFSVELQFSGELAGVDFVSGLYYFNEDGETNSGPFTFSPFNMPNSTDSFGVPFDLGFPTGFGFFDLNQETNSYAAFLNVKYDLTDSLTIGGGLRYSRDEKDADALFPSFPERAFREASFEELTWDVNVSYALSSEANVYAQIQKGYQTGGFPPRPFGGPAQFAQFDEQTAINYEIGYKGAVTQYADVLLSAFWTSYSDLALPFSDTQAGGGFVTIVENAGKSRSRGVELELNLKPVQNFNIRTAVGYIDAEIRRVDPGTIGIGVGDSPALTPEWTLSVAPTYTAPLGNGGSLQFNVDYSYRAKMFGQSINTVNEILDSRGILGFSVDYNAPDDSWTLGIYGENITNEVYDVGRLQQTGFVGVVRSNDRSEFGVRLTKRFN